MIGRPQIRSSENRMPSGATIHTRTGVVHRVRGSANAALADEPDEPAAQIFATEEHKNNKQQYKRCSPKWTD